MRCLMRVSSSTVHLECMCVYVCACRVLSVCLVREVGKEGSQCCTSPHEVTYVGCFVPFPMAIWYKMAVNCTMSSNDVKSSPEMYIALKDQFVITRSVLFVCLFVLFVVCFFLFFSQHHFKQQPLSPCLGVEQLHVLGVTVEWEGQRVGWEEQSVGWEGEGPQQPKGDHNYNGREDWKI